MPLDPQETAFLTDAQGRSLGRVSIGRIEGDRVFGRFAPEAEFASVRWLFAEFEQAVNDQVFSEADRLAGEIDRLGLRLSGAGGAEGLELRDVQIMEASVFCCRVPNLALTQVPRAVA